MYVHVHVHVYCMLRVCMSNVLFLWKIVPIFRHSCCALPCLDDRVHMYYIYTSEYANVHAYTVHVYTCMHILYVYSMYAVCMQYVCSMYAVCMQYVCSMYTVCIILYLLFMFLL